MKVTVKNPYWIPPLREAINLLALTSLCGKSLESARFRVEHAREILIALLLDIERKGDAQKRAHLYSDVANAAAFCTVAITEHPLDFHIIREALKLLRVARWMEGRS